MNICAAVDLPAKSRLIPSDKGCDFLLFAITRTLTPLPTAPLAQSVERFHGKEKVTGSIPVGGSEVHNLISRSNLDLAG